MKEFEEKDMQRDACTVKAPELLIGSWILW